MRRALVLLCVLACLPASAQDAMDTVPCRMDGSDCAAVAGTVTSVGNGTVGSLFSASWATATTTPALSLNLATQAANCVVAGPASGSNAVPTCRALVSLDVLNNLGGTYAKFASAASIGNGADTTIDALWTLTPIPANTFTADGDALVLTTGIQTGANANDKSFSMSVGGTVITASTVAWNNTAVMGLATITRVNATHINVFFIFTSTTGSVSRSSFNLAVSDLTANTLAVVVMGASPTTGAAYDVQLYSGVAEFKK